MSAGVRMAVSIRRHSRPVAAVSATAKRTDSQAALAA